MINDNSKIHVLWVLNGFEQNGISMFVLEYLKYLDKTKYHFYLGISGNNINDFLYKKIKNIKNIDIISLPCRNKGIFHYFISLIKTIKSKEIKIFHIHGNSSTITIDLLAAQISKCPIRIAHCHNSKSNHDIINKILQPFFNKMYSKGFACSKDAAIHMFGKNWETNKRISILKNGIECGKFIYNKSERKRIRNELQIKDSEIVLGHIGVFNNQKNQKFLIDIIELLQKSGKYNYKLVLVGNGPNKSKIEKLVVKKGLGKYIIFAGVRNDIPSVLCGFDIFLFPSIFEGLGIAVIEAQSSGLSCILSDKVPCITKILDSTQYITLDINLWSEKILEYKINNNRENSSFKVQSLGWDILDNCVILEKEYEKLIKQLS